MPLTCLSTDGSGYVRIPHDMKLGLSDFTVEAWVLPSSGGSIMNCKIDSGGSRDYAGFIFSISTDGRLHLALDSGFAFQSVDSHPTIDLFDGNWHHVAAVRQNLQLLTYLDGTLLHADAHGNGAPESMDLQGTAWPNICGGSGGGDLVTLIREVRLWRSARDIAGYAMRRAYNEPGLIGCWPFSEESPAERTNPALNGRLQGNCQFVPSTCPIDL